MAETEHGVATVELSVGILRKLKAEFPYDPARPFLDICREKSGSAQRIPETPGYCMGSAWMPVSM